MEEQGSLHQQVPTEVEQVVPLQKKLTLGLVALTVAGMAAVIALVQNPGRPAVAVLAAGCLGWFVTVRITHARYSAAMKAAAAEVGLDCVSSLADEERSEFLRTARRTREADVFRWKLDGKYPALAGQFDGFPVIVRVPVGTDFDAGAPDSTRITAYHNVKMTGFVIYDRTRLKKTPKGRQATLDDTAFDARFLVIAHRAEEAKAVLGPEVRAALLEAGSTGFRGLEVNRYGVFLHEEGKVSRAEVVNRRLGLVVKVARAAREMRPPSGA